MVTAGRRRASRCVGSSPTCCTKLVFDLCDIEVKKLSNLRYRVGDIVRVREGLERHKSYGNYYVTTEMAKLAGRKVTIESVLPDSYFIKETGCYWTDEMFKENIKTAEIDDKLRNNDTEISSETSIKDLFDLYNAEVKEVE